MNKEQIKELLVQLETRNKLNYRLWQMFEEDGDKTAAMRYFGQYTGLEEAIRELRKAAGIEYMEHIESCVAQGAGQ